LENAPQVLVFISKRNRSYVFRWRADKKKELIKATATSAGNAADAAMKTKVLANALQEAVTISKRNLTVATQVAAIKRDLIKATATSARNAADAATMIKVLANAPHEVVTISKRNRTEVIRMAVTKKEVLKVMTAKARLESLAINQEVKRVLLRKATHQSLSIMMI
ncbi:MAG: hypothetical protein ACK5FC_04345, partial [Bacteroidota bacterium]